jgi:hypothetical protein
LTGRYVESSSYNSLASILSTDSKEDNEEFYAMFAKDCSRGESNCWSSSQVAEDSCRESCTNVVHHR